MDIIPTRDQVPQISRAQRALGAYPGTTAHRTTRPGAGTGGITGKDLLKVLRKRMWTIILATLIVLVVTVAATLVWRLYWPLFTAKAFLEVSPPRHQVLGARGTSLVPKDIMDTLLRSQARVVQSEPVYGAAASDSRVRNTRWFQDDPTDAIKRLYEDVDVSPQPGTYHIMVSMTGQAGSQAEKNDLAQIVNAVAEAAVTQTQDTVTLQRTTEIVGMRVERDKLQRDLESIRRTAELARRSASIPSLQKRRTVVDFQLQALTGHLMQLMLIKAQVDSAMRALLEQEANGTIEAAPEVVQALEMDAQLRALRNAELNLETEQANFDRQFGPKHRSVLSLETRLKSIKDKIVDREGEMTRRAVGLLKSIRESEVVSVTAQLLQVQQKFNEANATVRDLEANLTKLEQYALQEEQLAEKINNIENRLLELRLLAGERQVSLRIRAIPPREISMPKWAVMVPLGFVLGLAIGLGLAFLLEFIDTSVKSPSDVTRRVDLPLLGMIPHSDDLEEDIEDLRVAFATHPNSLVGEAFRQIRTCLLFSGPASQRRSLLVTSPLPEDGRTTVALNLAAAIAHDGRKVLIVDANFRQPAIRQLFPECPEGGLSSALVGQANWSDLAHEVQPNLHVLPAGMLPPNPAELLGSEEMRTLIAEMVGQYDQVIIDGAPCLVVTDSAILSTLVDGVVLTVRAGANSYGIVQRTRDMLQRVGAHIVGVALNGVRVTAGGYLRKSYETFYEYHEQSQLPTG